MFAIVQDTFTPKVGRWALMFKGPAQRRAFLMRWGATIRKRAMENAAGKGGRRLWRDIARSVNVKAVTSDSVEVGAYHVAAAQKQFGGPIAARGKAAGGADMLTIPIAPEADGQSAAKFALAGRKLFVFLRSNLLGYMEDDGLSFHPLFALTRRTKPQRAFPWWPEPEFIEARGIEQAKAALGFS